MKKISAVLKKLSLDDLREWAGAKILNRGISYVKNVKGLSRTADDALAAWVSGSDEYATTIHLAPDGDHDYFCTCPYDWGPCKHAVAVILAAAEHVKLKRDIPLLDEGDDLLQALFDDSDDGYEDDDDLEYLDEEPDDIGIPANEMNNAGVRKIFEGMGKDELVSLLVNLNMRYPEIGRGLLEKEQIKTGKVDKIVNSLRREIRELAAEDSWYNPWRGEGNLPDYSHVRKQLQALLDSGNADAVLQLGEELWTRGNRQVEQSNDEGDTATEIAKCMDVVVKAVIQSSKTQTEQLLWMIDHILSDEFALLEAAGKVLESEVYTHGQWSEVAGVLEARLKSMDKPPSTGFSETYRRNRLLDMLIDAFERSGRRKAIIPLLEKEADVCQCYGKLVEALIAAGEKEKARKWCIHGFKRTTNNAPGIASALQDKLRLMAEKEMRHDLAAAYRAQDFFTHPSRKSYTDLQKAAEKAKAWPAVRGSALSYLETGQRPDLSGGGKGNEWPLPVPEVERPLEKVVRLKERFPDLDMLIDIAILEKRLDDVVSLHQEYRKTRRWGWETDKDVADAVADSHPQTALDIWRAIAESLIGQVTPKAYEEAAIYLRRMCKVYRETGRAPEWLSLLGELRRQHKAKRRLMGVLDGLEGKKITD